jgi:tripartite-type tricarboxylate transporter receptor subunit TctC
MAAAFGITANAMAADDVESFYKGRQMKIIVGSGPAGGYDAYARLIERHIGKHIPGHPTFIT